MSGRDNRWDPCVMTSILINVYLPEVIRSLALQQQVPSREDAQFLVRSTPKVFRIALESLSSPQR